MRHLTYLAVLAGCVAGASWLELWPGTRVHRRLGRLAQAVLPTSVAFIGWDLYSISRHHWSYDPAQTIGVVLPGGLPLEEVLFFLVVPTCAVLALEAVRRVTGWPTGEGPRRTGAGNAGLPAANTTRAARSGGTAAADTAGSSNDAGSAGAGRPPP